MMPAVRSRGGKNRTYPSFGFVFVCPSGIHRHYDGSLFSTYASAAVDGTPVGTATDMFTISNRQMTEWVGGSGGVPTRTPAFFVPYGGWRAPSGRVYASGSGLLVH